MTSQTNTLSLAIIQTTSSDDVAVNIAAVEARIAEAAAHGAAFIALPENAFFMRREAHHKDDREQGGNRPPRTHTSGHPGVMAMQKAAKTHGVWILIGSISPIESEAQPMPFNRSVLINAGGVIVATYDKIHLFDVALENGECYAESARVIAGQQAVVADTPWGGLGMTICYDLRFPALYRDLALHGAKIISVPAAFIVATGKVHWHTLLKSRAIETGCFIIAPAQCGEHPGGRRSYGHALVVSPWGEILADGGEAMGIVYATLNMAEVDAARKRVPCLKHGRQYSVASQVPPQPDDDADACTA